MNLPGREILVPLYVIFSALFQFIHFFSMWKMNFWSSSSAVIDFEVASAIFWWILIDLSAISCNCNEIDKDAQLSFCLLLYETLADAINQSKSQSKQFMHRNLNFVMKLIEWFTKENWKNPFDFDYSINSIKMAIFSYLKILLGTYKKRMWLILN